MVLVAADGVERIGWSQEVARNKLSSLVNELVE